MRRCRSWGWLGRRAGEHPAEQPGRIGSEAHGQQCTRNEATFRFDVACAVPARDVDLEPTPTERSPQQRFDPADRLYARVRNRFGTCLQESAAQPQAVGRFLNLFGPQGLDLRLAGLCDAGEEREFRRGLERAGLGSELTRADMESLGFYVCDSDLVDELIRALGATSVERVVDANGDLRAFRTLQKQPGWMGRRTEEQLRRFMGSGGRRKILDFYQPGHLSNRGVSRRRAPAEPSTRCGTAPRYGAARAGRGRRTRRPGARQRSSRNPRRSARQ